MRSTLRRVLFWLHLAAGVLAGAVVLIMAVTGVLLTYEKQVIAWADARALPPRAAAAPGTPRPALAPLAQLLAGARTLQPQGKPSAVTIPADPAAPVLVAFGRDGVAYVDAASGRPVGTGSPGTRAFFHAVTDVHRWLAAEGEGRKTGKAVTGASNLAFLFLVLSGAVLWIPRPWTRRRVRNVGWFRRGLSGRARDFNWHNVIGVWSVVPLAVVVASATVISYPWASALVFRAFGEEAPKQQPPASPGPAGGGVDVAGLDPLVTAAVREAGTRVPGWRTVQLRLPAPAGKPVPFTVDAGSGGQPQARATLTLDRATAAVSKWEPFDALTPGRRARSVLRFAHTGEVLGIPGQTAAGLASLGAAVLVLTGLALSLRRLRRWAGRRNAPAGAQVEEQELVAA